MTGRFLGLDLARYHRPAVAHHAVMAGQAGSEQIASAFALQVLMALLEKLQPARVLEVGSGIGTMTALLTARCTQVYAVEDNVWCMTEMRRLGLVDRGRLCTGLGYLHGLIVVDGDQVTPAMALELLKHRGWILVEGNRRRWRASLKYGYRPFAEVNLRPFDQSKGVWLLAFEPTTGLRFRFAAERLWQGAQSFLSRAWSFLTGAPSFHGKKRPMSRTGSL